MDSKTKSVPRNILQNKVKTEILAHSDVFLNNKELYNNVILLKKANLLNEKVVCIKTLDGIGKVNYVLNDFHSKSTNNGYSRNFGGLFFNR